MTDQDKKLSFPEKLLFFVAAVIILFPPRTEFFRDDEGRRINELIRLRRSNHYDLQIAPRLRRQGVSEGAIDVDREAYSYRGKFEPLLDETREYYYSSPVAWLEILGLSNRYGVEVSLHWQRLLLYLGIWVGLWFFLIFPLSRSPEKN